MQFLSNKLGFNFGTHADKADAYSPFASVATASYSTSTTSRTNAADCSLITVGSQAAKPSMCWP